MICPWFGPLPPWWKSYLEHWPEGYDRLDWRDLPAFAERVRERLGIACPIEPGSAKIHDFRACFGELFAEEIRGYDFWGHTDFDCVYGRPGHFMPDEQLEQLDVHSDHWEYLCGPWTLYRALPELASAFREQPGWQEILSAPEASGWVETSFSDIVRRSGLRVRFELFHGWQHPLSLRWDGPALLEAGIEVSLFHFRRSKTWPVIA